MTKMLVEVALEHHGEPMVPNMRPGWERKAFSYSLAFSVGTISEFSTGNMEKKTSFCFWCEAVSRAAFCHLFVNVGCVAFEFVAVVGK